MYRLFTKLSLLHAQLYTGVRLQTELNGECAAILTQKNAARPLEFQNIQNIN